MFEDARGAEYMRSRTLADKRACWETPAKAEERDAGALVVAALAADQKAKTRRRTMKSRNQETAVKDVLRDACGMKEGPSREIKTIVDFPERGVFFDKETTVAGQKADVVAILHDGRLLCLDCKVSSLETNSYKRLCHEVTDKAAKWREAFGQTSVTGAVLAGCFKPGNLLEAQEAGVRVFWSDALSPLVEFVNSTKECNDGQ